MLPRKSGRYHFGRDPVWWLSDHLSHYLRLARTDGVLPGGAALAPPQGAAPSRTHLQVVTFPGSTRQVRSTCVSVRKRPAHELIVIRVELPTS